ncbi:hypothetical protein [Nocardia amikacinitolerans]|uniref:hypothetical protein n=1 Tax=Nocardia amikacinitolerans TaxID=756689 RepID=UPI00082C851C|nr:hypothetical protein [Nocardia amikacinitolerans]
MTTAAKATAPDPHMLRLGASQKAAGRSVVLLDRTPDWQPWLRWTIAFGAMVIALGLVRWHRPAVRPQ